MKNSWQEDYTKSCRALSFEKLLDVLLDLIEDWEHAAGADNTCESWKKDFLKKEIVARHKNK